MTNNQPDTPIITADTKPNKRFLSRKRLFFGIIIVILLIAAAVLYFFEFNKSGNDSAQTNVPPLAEQNRKTIDELIVEIKNTPPPTNSQDQAYLAIKYLNLGNLYNEKSDYTSAIDAFTKIYDPAIIPKAALSTIPKLDMYAQASLGAAYGGASQYQKAIDAYTKALELANQKTSDGKALSPEDAVRYQETIRLIKTSL